jgi:hypothetical protein
VPTYETIPVKPATKRLLEAAKHPGESFDAVVRRALKEAEDAKRRAFFDDLETLLQDDASFKPLK